MSTPFTKIITTKTIKYRYYFLPVTNIQLTVHNRSSLFLLLTLPLVSILFPAPCMAETSGPLLLGSFLTTVLVRHPEKFVIPMVIFILSRPGSCLDPRGTNSNTTTVILRKNISLLSLPLTLPPRPSLTFLQKILPVYIQLILPVILLVKIFQAYYLHFHLRIHYNIYHQKNLPQFRILDQECPSGDLSSFPSFLPSDLPT